MEPNCNWGLAAATARRCWNWRDWTSIAPPAPRGIRRQIAQAAKPLIERHRTTAIGFGFGGPVDSRAGRVVKSHQIHGWDAFPLIAWCGEQFGLPAVLANDTDAGGLAEARFGAGRGRRVVFYTNVGSGVGGALVIDGRLYCDGERVTAEIGHVRPGVYADRPDQTVESLASGWAISDACAPHAPAPIGPIRRRPRTFSSVARATRSS